MPAKFAQVSEQKIISTGSRYLSESTPFKGYQSPNNNHKYEHAN